jgi:hypothetical protein
MGGIIGGPSRFAEVVDVFAGSGEYDLVLAVSTAHPPAHTEQRVAALVGLLSPQERSDVGERAPKGGEGSSGGAPVLHLWMAGDQGRQGLLTLRGSGAAVSEEPRAAIRALAGLARLSRVSPPGSVEPVDGDFEDWGLPLVEGAVVTDAEQAVVVAERLGYPVVVKLSSPGLAHKTEVGGVKLSLEAAGTVSGAFDQVMKAGRDAGLVVDGARVEKYRPGLELIVGALIDPVFGPVASVGMGGVLTEVLGDVVFAPAPVDEAGARGMIERLKGRRLLDGYRGSRPADRDELARFVSTVSRGLVGSGLQEVEINPLVWTGDEWVAVDWLVVGTDPLLDAT